MIAILGGGMRGISLAYYLSKKGYDICLIEKDENLGGVCSSIKIGNIYTTIFYHVLMPTDFYFFNFLKDLNIFDRLQKTKTTIGFYYSKKIYPLNTLKEFLDFKPLTFINRIKLGIGMLYAKTIKNWENYEKITAIEFTKKLFNEQINKIIWKPLLKAKFGDAYTKINAADLIHRIKRMTSDTKNVKSDYLLYVKGTLKYVIDTCEKELINNKVKIIKGKSITRLEEINNNKIMIKLENEEKIICDKCISTIALNELAKILDNEKYNKYIENISKIKYLNNACLILNLTLPLTKFYQLNISDDEIPLTGILGLSNVYNKEEFNNTHIFYLSNYFLEDENNKLFSFNEETILKYYKEYIKYICPDFNENWIIDLKLIKRRNVEVFHSLNYSKIIPTAETPIKNLLICTNAQVYPKMTVLNTVIEHTQKFIEKYF